MELLLNVNLNELIAGCKNRDAECQKLLFKAYYGKMFGICLRYCNTREDAQDVVQEGFIKLFEKIDLYTDSGSFDGWIRRMFVNLSLDHLRRNKTHLVSIDDQNYHMEIRDNSEDDIDQSIIKLVSPERLIEEIQNLSPVYRTVLNLYIFEGYTHDDIAQELGISSGTSKSNLYKAKVNLKKALTKIIKAKHAS